MKAAHAERFYFQWHRLLAAGMPPVKALEQLSTRFSGPTASQARNILRTVFSEGENARTNHAKSWDWQMLRVGRQTGSLVRITELLAGHFAASATLRRRLWQRAIYPLFLFHLGAVLLALPAAVAARDPSVFFVQCGLALGALYGFLAAAWGLLILMRWLLRRAAGFDRFVLALPWLGSWRQEAVAEPLARLLSLQMQAGVGVLSSLEGAASVLGSAALEPQVRHARDAIRDGATFSEAMELVRPLPQTLREAIWTGEQSGNLTAELDRAATELSATRERRLESLADWLPRFFYLAVALLIAWRIVSMMSGYYQSLEGLLDGSF
jgi:general secretion pathway protein F